MVLTLASFQVKDFGGNARTIGTVLDNSINYGGTVMLMNIGGNPTMVGSSNPMPCSISGTVPISGTIGAAQSGAWNVTLLAGTAYIGRVRLTDGTRDVTLKQLTNANAVPVAIVDANGDLVSSFGGGGGGGGTQYADGAAVGTPTGTSTNWNEAGNQRAVSMTKPLPTQPGTGSVFPTASAGTEKISSSTITGNTSAYTAGDVVGGKLTFTNAARANDKAFRIVGGGIYDANGVAMPLDLLLFNEDPSNTTFTNNSPIDLHANDAVKCIGRVSFSDYLSTGTNKAFCPVDSMALATKPAAGTRNIFGVLVAKDAGTFSSNTALTLFLTVDQD